MGNRLQVSESIFNMKKKILKLAKFIVFFFGVLFFAMLAISFTSLPYWGIYRLAIVEFSFTPDLIVVMGGSGVPSQTALMRTYHTANLAKAFPQSSIIIALPDENLQDSTSHLQKMKNELRMRLVVNPIFFEPNGTNTRAQALEIKKQMKNQLNKKVVIVSSPEHIYRATQTFKKIGFTNVGGYPAFEEDLNLSLDFDADELGGIQFVPDVGKHTQLRYQFWNHLIYEIKLLREYVAIVYYKLEGWM